MRIRCNDPHKVDAHPETEAIRWARLGQHGTATREPDTAPEASNAWEVVWDGNNAWGFYSTSELEAVAVPLVSDNFREED